MKRPFLEISHLVDRKLRNEIEFDMSEQVFLAPAIDYEGTRKNWILTAFAASGAGKSYAIQQTLLRAPHRDEITRVYLFGSVGQER